MLKDDKTFTGKLIAKYQDNVELTSFMQHCDAGQQILEANIVPPPYDEVVKSDMKGLPTYWQASCGDALGVRNA